MFGNQPSGLDRGQSETEAIVDGTPSLFQGQTKAAYFVENEIDSLFGSSSGTGSIYDEDDEDDDDIQDEDEVEEKEEAKEEAVEEVEVGAADEVVEKDKEFADNSENKKTEDAIKPKNEDEEDEDIDELLTELTQSANGEKPKATVKDPFSAEARRARELKASTRKIWANTKLLTIEDFETYIPDPALTFPFKLDVFQQQAIARLNRSENVFVAAHTSAGKTVVAEYAIALALRNSTKCVYTSPIKALSNQKFRDFADKFGAKNVGLMTGDIQVNATDCSCLILTTEILRSMLYRGADMIRDIEYVVFDEVHYINDPERGVVWEETIIMLPASVTMVFLSATTPNTIEFSDWIGRTKRKPVHVVTTNFRPVPLSYNLWAGKELHKVMEGKSGFLEKGYRDAANALLPASAKDPKKKDDPKAKLRKPATGSKAMVWQAQGDKSNWVSLVNYLDRYVMTPTVVFSFSKKKCEEIARMLQSVDLNTAKERSAVQGFTLQAVGRLSENDKKLPQVEMISEMVQRGIGVHHGGLLPILKECVEILFSRNLIKILLATETFAMGVNMPAKAVVFNSIRKHDGTQFRNLQPGEMTQMAGRAGRRGLDDVGTVILCCFGEEPPPIDMLRQVLTGSSMRLKSQFRLTYNMILNLLRVEDLSVEGMIRRSFSEFAMQKAMTTNNFPHLLRKGRRKLSKIEEELAVESSKRDGAEDLEEYFRVSTKLISTNREILEFIHGVDSSAYSDLLTPGRVLLITAAREHGVVRQPAIVLKLPDSSGRQGYGDVQRSTPPTLVCMVLLPSSQSSSNQESSLDAGTVGSIGSCNGRRYAISNVGLSQIFLVLDRKTKIDSSKILKDNTAKTSHGRGGEADFFAGMKPVGKKKQNDDVLSGSRGGGRGGEADFFSGMTPVGKKKESSDRGGDADFFAGMKPAGKKKQSDGGRGGDADFFSGIKAVGKKKQTDDFLSGGRTKQQNQEEIAVDLLKEVETKELSENGLASVDLKRFVQRGPDIFRIREACQRCNTLAAQARSFVSHHHPSLETHYLTFEKKGVLEEKLRKLQHFLSNESLSLFPDFQQRKAVLKTLGYLDENETVSFKGRVACEVNTCEELIATEMVFEGVLDDLKPEEIAAVLSALVFQEKNDSELDSDLPETLKDGIEKMKTIATGLGQVQKDAGLPIDPGEYCDGSLKFGLVHVVYEWALGITFKSICQLTDVQEGSIVRCITRLDELCGEVANCARVVGNQSLHEKLESAREKIKRDIVFASSLYLS